jgi:hypothetical protein
MKAHHGMTAKVKGIIADSAGGADFAFSLCSMPCCTASIA